METKVFDDLPSNQWLTQPANKAWNEVQHFGKAKTVSAKALICKPGDEVRSIFVVKSGILHLYAVGPDGHQRTLWFMGPGSILGDTAMFYGRPYMHYCLAIHDSVLIEFSKDTLYKKLIPNYPQICLTIFKNLSIKSYIMSTQLEEVSFLSTEKRLARFLYQHVMVDEQGLSKLTHKLLASLLGMHRVTITKLIGKFKKEGILEDQRNLSVINLKKLAKMI